MSRVASVVDALAKLIEFDAHFFIPKGTSVSDKLIADKYQLTTYAVRNTEVLTRAFEFEDQVEQDLERGEFDLIIRDIYPLYWTPSIDWKGVPTIKISNVYVINELASRFDPVFRAKQKEPINERRASKGLPPLESFADLYAADQLYLADALPLFTLFPPLTANQIAAGACCWSASGDLPATLRQCAAPLVVSVGSTGVPDIDPADVRHLAEVSGADVTVYAGAAQFDDPELSSVFDFVLPSVPLAELLPRAACVVTQGGAGSTYLALQSGRPTLTNPTLENHFILSTLLERLGVCVSIKRTRAQATTRADLARLAVAATDFKQSMGDGAATIANGIRAFLTRRS